MRNILLSLIIGLSLIICVPAFAQNAQQAQNDSAKPLTPEEIAKLRQDLNKFSAAFGDKDKTSDNKSAENHKTVGDVADKALNLFSGAIGSFI